VGSIPAGTGEPRAASSQGQGRGVYPRGHGGAQNLPSFIGRGSGLSPRARGSRVAGPFGVFDQGSIPAGTGEPRPRPAPSRRSGVYPRGHGGAPDTITISVPDGGLSPRARGSRASRMATRRLGGSIPAGTGEPRWSAAIFWRWGVYPRGHGGATAPSDPVKVGDGLSPRARGSPTPQPCRASLRGSIPAGTGEPDRYSTEIVLSGVYPRGHGGADFRLPMSGNLMGLSPRARGSRAGRSLDRPHDGSIPAGTGEPS